ncbi:MAG TPA: hypothetical protein VG146_20605 [Verrucomicrobiae bacterium]|nr:hypothetical protein [Verrucomicrobiae bacterium]
MFRIVLEKRERFAEVAGGIERLAAIDCMKSSFVGRWRIVEMEQWEQEFVDLVAPGHITFASGGRGQFSFGAVEANLDWRQDPSGKRVSFSFEGFDEGDEVSGRGWAEPEGGRLTGRIVFHLGDESGFVAQRSRRT